MTILYGPMEVIAWRDRDYTFFRQPMPSNVMDNPEAWQILLHDYQSPDDWMKTELWVKWDGLDNKDLQIIQIINDEIPTRESYLTNAELHDYIHEYALIYTLSPSELAFAVDGLELALHLLTK